MNYENQPCPCCGHHMHEGDDIVVCPVCATPQHRSCWLEEGKCINDNKHSEGFIWSLPDSNTNNTNQRKCNFCGEMNPLNSSFCSKCGGVLNNDTNGQKNDNLNNRFEVKPCRNCGTLNNAMQNTCQNCGEVLEDIIEIEQKSNPYINNTGLNPDEVIGEHTVDEISLFVRSKPATYVKKFKNIITYKKISFNFSAFLFGPYWFFFRKIYKAGAVFMAVFSVLSLIITGAIERCSDIINPYVEAIQNQTITPEEFTILSNRIFERIGSVLLIVTAINIFVRIICGLFADKLYYNNMINAFAVFKERIADPNLRRMYISRRGGVSVLAIPACFCIMDIFSSLLMFIADKIK
ncbi:MAG: DUF2628 domain-containing protein [Clostridiales bacterium]|nr:DUF2628 domain-containing protein [Clostridiales bacterium]